MTMASATTAARTDAPLREKLLLVDDEPAIRWALRKMLQGSSFEIVEAESGEQALALVRTAKFDVLLLDVAMPGLDGIETCRRIRRALPLAGIIMLTVNQAEENKVEALDAGADDYVTKPFHAGELAARLRALLRRSRAGLVERDSPLKIGDIELDPGRRILRRAEEEIHLTRKEFEVLHLLISNAGLPLTHSRILRTVWGPEYGSEVEYLRTFVRQLRKKLGDDAARPRYIITEPQIGYRFASESDRKAQAGS